MSEFDEVVPYIGLGLAFQCQYYSLKRNQNLSRCRKVGKCRDVANESGKTETMNSLPPRVMKVSHDVYVTHHSTRLHFWPLQRNQAFRSPYSVVSRETKIRKYRQTSYSSNRRSSYDKLLKLLYHKLWHLRLRRRLGRCGDRLNNHNERPRRSHSGNFWRPNTR